MFFQWEQDPLADIPWNNGSLVGILVINSLSVVLYQTQLGNIGYKKTLMCGKIKGIICFESQPGQHHIWNTYN